MSGPKVKIALAKLDGYENAPGARPVPQVDHQAGAHAIFTPLVEPRPHPAAVPSQRARQVAERCASAATGQRCRVVPQ